MSIYINYLYKREGAEKSVCVFDKILKAENCLDCVRGGARRGGGGASDKPRQARSKGQRDKSQSVERLGTRAFLSQFGWDIEEDPVEVAEVIIPAEFDRGYEKYNEIQKAQNLDLTPYAGKRAKRWTYNIKNYPGYEGDSGTVQANILVYEGAVIGGDICSTELDGFMQGFDFPTKNAAQNESTT